VALLALELRWNFSIVASGPTAHGYSHFQSLLCQDDAHWQEGVRPCPSCAVAPQAPQFRGRRLPVPPPRCVAWFPAGADLQLWELRKLEPVPAAPAAPS
jgi:hypothetical protein